MDFDGDGINDIISGSYWPGELYFFKGLSSGEFAKGEVLKDSEKRNLLASGPWASEHEMSSDSLAAVPFAVDFNGNGVLDLIVGNIEGTIILIPNEGTAAEPKFVVEKRVKLMAGGTEIKVGYGDSGPIMVDFDGDGLKDLITGAGDGSVWFYKNVGTKTQPEFAAGVALVEPIDVSAMYRRDADAAPFEITRCGMRTKVHVADYTGNGRLDLLVGDFMSIPRPEPKLNDEQIARRDELRTEQQSIQTELQPIYQRFMTDGGNIDFEKIQEDEEFKAMQEKMMSIWNELRQYEAGSDTAGFVWLYARKAE